MIRGDTVVDTPSRGLIYYLPNLSRGATNSASHV